MRLHLLVILLLLLVTCVTAQKNLREVSLRINGVGNGTSYSTVLKKLGRPSKRKTEKVRPSEACSNLAETHLTLFYPGLEIALLGDGRGRKLDVYRIDVTAKKWSASGIRIGANSKTLVAKFRRPNSEAEISGEHVFYYVTPGNTGGVNFYFRNSRLVRILMNETLC